MTIVGKKDSPMNLADTVKALPVIRETGGGKILAHERVGVMPLAVLLPSEGDLGLLPEAAEKLAARLKEIRGEFGTMRGEEGVEKISAEEAMIVQALSWLDPAGEEE